MLNQVLEERKMRNILLLKFIHLVLQLIFKFIIMKNICKKTFLSLFVIGLFTTSCSDAIDITQKGTATEEVIYRTLEDLQAGLNAAYLQYNPGGNANGNGDVILFNDL